MLDRRRFLMLSAAGAAAACSKPGSPGASGPKALDVAMTPAESQIDLGGVIVRTWAYDGRVPGKEIRLHKGEILHATLNNKLPADTTVHWHGLAIPNPMDGVPVLTQPATKPGQRFDYEFVVPDSGTYWFHSHVGTQNDRGLYGPLIIEDPNERTNYDDELVLVLDDWIDGIHMTPDTVRQRRRHTDHPARRRRWRRPVPALPDQRPHEQRPANGRLSCRTADSDPDHQCGG
jgi:FtsP/CotA-like multicopper oxidase with cupredoxin domain